MLISFVPLLKIQRDLYDLPAGPGRFRAYVDTMTGSGDEMVLPLSLMNPMAKPHVAAYLDALLAFDAEAVARAAIDEAQLRLGGATNASADSSVALVVADDAQGGWTQRQFTDAAHRFEDRHAIARGWITVVLWSSDEPSPANVRREVMTAIYRVAYIQRYGFPTTLEAMLRQEGYAAAFADAKPALDESALAHARTVIAAQSATTSSQVIFACLFGDAAATAVGYDPLGLEPNAGLDVALADALASGVIPSSLLRAP
jgi:hypothetical protein